MGYFLNSLGNLPLDDEVEFYIFVVNGFWREPLYDMIEKNFAGIARNIGHKAAITMGLEPTSWRDDVAVAILGQDNRALARFVPALIITNAHPKELLPDSLRLLVPLRDIEARFGGWPEFFRLMSEFVKMENEEFLERFKTMEDAFDVANRVVSVKPGLFGISINLNEFAIWWRNRARERRGARRGTTA